MDDDVSRAPFLCFAQSHSDSDTIEIRNKFPECGSEVRNVTFKSTSNRFLVLQYVVFKNVPLNLVVRVTAFAQEKSLSERACQSDTDVDSIEDGLSPSVASAPSTASSIESSPIEGSGRTNAPNPDNSEELFSHAHSSFAPSHSSSSRSSSSADISQFQQPAPAPSITVVPPFRESMAPLNLKPSSPTTSELEISASPESRKTMSLTQSTMPLTASLTSATPLTKSNFSSFGFWCGLNRICIGKQLVCDGKDDCLDGGSDEEGCVTEKPTKKMVTSTTTTTIEAVTTMENTNLSIPPTTTRRLETTQRETQEDNFSSQIATKNGDSVYADAQRMTQDGEWSTVETTKTTFALRQDSGTTSAEPHEEKTGQVSPDGIGGRENEIRLETIPEIRSLNGEDSVKKAERSSRLHFLWIFLVIGLASIIFAAVLRRRKKSNLVEPETEGPKKAQEDDGKGEGRIDEGGKTDKMKRRRVGLLLMAPNVSREFCDQDADWSDCHRSRSDRQEKEKKVVEQETMSAHTEYLNMAQIRVSRGRIDHKDGDCPTGERQSQEEQPEDSMRKSQRSTDYEESCFSTGKDAECQGRVSCEDESRDNNLARIKEMWALKNSLHGKEGSPNYKLSEKDGDNRCVSVALLSLSNSEEHPEGGKQRNADDETTMTTAIQATLKSGEKGISDEAVFCVSPSTAPHPDIDRENHGGYESPTVAGIFFEERRGDPEKDKKCQSPNRKSPTGGGSPRPHTSIAFYDVEESMKKSSSNVFEKQLMRREKEYYEIQKNNAERPRSCPTGGRKVMSPRRPRSPSKATIWRTNCLGSDLFRPASRRRRINSINDLLEDCEEREMEIPSECASEALQELSDELIDERFDFGGNLLPLPSSAGGSRNKVRRVEIRDETGIVVLDTIDVREEEEEEEQEEVEIELALAEAAEKNDFVVLEEEGQGRNEEDEAVQKVNATETLRQKAPAMTPSREVTPRSRPMKKEMSTPPTAESRKPPQSPLMAGGSPPEPPTDVVLVGVEAKARGESTSRNRNKGNAITGKIYYKAPTKLRMTKQKNATTSLKPEEQNLIEAIEKENILMLHRALYWCKKQGMCATDSFLVDSAEKKVDELRQNLICLHEEAEREKRRRKEKMRILEEQAISEENKKSQAKLYLQVALLAENEGQINNVIQNNFVNRKIPMDAADQKEVKDTLGKIAVDQKLDVSAQNNIVEEMENALKAAHRLCLSQRVNVGTKARMMRVEDKLGRAMSLENLRLEIMTMNIQCIVEVFSYVRPPQGVQTVLRAVLILLGIEQRYLKNWRAIKKEMHQIGTENMRTKIVELDPRKVPVRISSMAEEWIKAFDMTSIHAISQAVAAFYRWTSNIVTQVKIIQKQNENAFWCI